MNKSSIIVDLISAKKNITDDYTNMVDVRNNSNDSITIKVSFDTILRVSEINFYYSEKNRGGYPSHFGVDFIKIAPKQSKRLYLFTNYDLFACDSASLRLTDEGTLIPIKL